MLYRKLLKKEEDKTFIRFIDTDKKSRELYIYKRGDKRELQKVKEYASINNLDVLAYSNTITLSKGEWSRYYRNSNINIDTSKIYDMDTLFIDIDMSLYDNYYSLQKALKESGINNYKVLESASGNIHLYIYTSKFQNKEDYRVIVQAIGDYLKRYDIEIDISSLNPIQKTYLEEFRVLSKRSFCSKYIKELSQKGDVQTTFQILQEMHKRGVKIDREFSIKYGMHIIQNELLNTYSGELHLEQLHQKYLVPKYTFSRALGVLQHFKAIRYKTIRGTQGYIQITYYNELKFNSCIEQQMTRKQNYHYLNTLYPIIRYLIHLYRYILFECCKYIEKSIGTFQRFVSMSIQNGYVQGLLSGNSGVKRVQNQGQKIFEDVITEGTRNKTLYKALVRARYQGVEGYALEDYANDIHSKMQQNPLKPFTKSEVKSVLKWASELSLHNRIN